MHSELASTSDQDAVINSPYLFSSANDDDEAKRLDKMQYVVRTIWGGNVLVPIIKTPTLILDIGTGSGSTALHSHC
jgi:hypothetical protein